VADSRAALIEIERVVPARDSALFLRLARDAIDADDTLNVPGEVLAVELDLEMCQPIAANPLGQRLRQAIADALFDVGIRQWVEGADEVVQRHPRLRLRADVAVESLASEIGTQIMAEVMVHEVAAI